jgi:hypothetical protein
LCFWNTPATCSAGLEGTFLASRLLASLDFDLWPGNLGDEPITDYFTIDDFVKAHELFQDPEWDGEPVAPEPKEPQGKQPGGTKEPPAPYNPNPGPKPKWEMIRVELSDGRARNIQHMTCTTFWHPDGMPMTAYQFVEALFGERDECLEKRFSSNNFPLRSGNCQALIRAIEKSNPKVKETMERFR